MKKHRIHPDTHLVSALILFVVVILAFLLSYQGFLSRSGSIACTEEARVCANGTTVTRSGPLCEFAACPNDNLPDRPGITEEPLQAPAPKDATKSGEEIKCTLEVKTCSDGSFVTRTGPECAFAPCPDDLELDTYR